MLNSMIDYSSLHWFLIWCRRDYSRNLGGDDLPRGALICGVPHVDLKIIQGMSCNLIDRITHAEKDLGERHRINCPSLLSLP